MTGQRRQLGMFAKFWEPGRVKTRLAAAIGPEGAAELQRAFVEQLLNQFRDYPADRLLAYSPPERRGEFEPLAAHWRLEPQSAGDLGARIDHFFRAGFAAGFQQVVLLGSDSPTLPRAWVDEAYAALADVEVVLGPSADGGYYLIGARDRVPPIFAGIPWSTSEVLKETVARLEAAGLPYQLLPPWYDVDEVADLRRLADELGPDGSPLAMLVQRLK